MRIRNRTSQMRGLPEGTPQRTRASSITKWIYILFIVSLLFYLLYVLTMRVTSYTARGYVEIEKINIATLRGGVISDLGVIAGERVAAGEVIAMLQPAVDCRNDFDSRGEKIRFDIELDKSDLASLRSELKSLNGQIVDEGIRRALEVERDYLQSNSKVRKASAELRREIATLEQRIRIQQRRYQAHRQQLASVDPDERCLNESVIAPKAGQILAVKRAKQEVVERGSTIFRMVPAQAAVFIDAAIDSGDMKYLQQGATVRVIFPDGVQSEGVVESIQSAASEGLSHRWGGYEADPSKVIARLIPESREARTVWMNYDRIEVKVKGSK